MDKKYDLLLKKTLKNIDKFTSISKNIKNDLLKLKVKKQKIIMIPNGIYLKKFKEIKNIRKIDKTIRLITVARYAVKKKGYDLVPKLTKLFIKKRIHFKWTIIGKNTTQLFNDKTMIKNKKNLIF